ncbi:uncharacterized protein [Venturia canescens]|uniref:uncharacterized protein n=1 Tax=Venturia canescens TaxID=32260 RepID=UPI001C9CDB02|nr:uncharacterized protein LOC122408475 [Venturia canescens]
MSDESRRGVLEAPRIRGLVDEIRCKYLYYDKSLLLAVSNTAANFTIGYRQFYDAGSNEEKALAEATRAVEETDLERQTALYQPQHEERAEEEPRASTSAASAEPIPLQPESDDDKASTILNPSLMFSDRSDILAVYRQARANDDDGAIADLSYHHHRQQEDDLVQRRRRRRRRSV